MEKYHAYESWLKANNYITWNTYLGYMRQIEKDLAGIDLEKINSTSFLEKLRVELQSKAPHIRRKYAAKHCVIAYLCQLFPPSLVLCVERKHHPR